MTDVLYPHLIVAFTGKRGSGKDTAAKALHPLGYTSLSFADPLREVLTTVYGITPEEMAHPVIKEQPLNYFPFMSPRELMTTMGTQGFRDLIHQETWVRALERRAQFHQKVVVPDLRFLTEETMLKSHDAIIIRVVSPTREKKDDHAQHRSETEMEQIVPHFTIENEGTVAELHAEVLRVLGLIAVKTYRMRTHPIKAVQWHAPGDHPGVQFMRSMGGVSYLSDRYAVLDNGHWTPVEPGDWIITDEKGVTRWVPQTLFDTLYEPVTG